MEKKRFFTDKSGQPIVFYHGTGYFFERFEPLSQFTTRRKIAEIYRIKPHRSSTCFSFDDQLNNVRVAVFQKLATLEREKYLGKEITEGYLIPAHLKMEKTLHLNHETFSYWCGLEGVVFAVLKAKNPNIDDEVSHPASDFIFVDPMKRPIEAVRHELGLETLFPVTPDEKRDRVSLSKQRFIRFLESAGYDSISHAYAGRAYAIFRPEQVHRLDYPQFNRDEVRMPLSNKIELCEIRKTYMRTYRHRSLTLSECLARQDYCPVRE